MKKILIFALCLVGFSQPAMAQSAPATVINAPASDNADSFDPTRLPKNFPIIGEMELAVSPTGCGLSKSKRLSAEEGQDYSSRYVFTQLENDGSDEALYQLGVAGELRTFKPSGAADMEAKQVRYFKTIDGPDVEVMVAIETDEQGQETGIVGRIKAWDADLPLMCAYNRIEVVGNCDL